MMFDMQEQTVVEDFFIFPGFVFAAPQINTPPDTNTIFGNNDGTNITIGGNVSVNDHLLIGQKPDLGGLTGTFPSS